MTARDVLTMLAMARGLVEIAASAVESVRTLSSRDRDAIRRELTRLRALNEASEREVIRQLGGSSG